jgi:hypothetical protein
MPFVYDVEWRNRSEALLGIAMIRRYPTRLSNARECALQHAQPFVELLVRYMLIYMLIAIGNRAPPHLQCGTRTGKILIWPSNLPKA